MARTTSRPRLLVVTPDYPPAHGGIQTLVARIVLHAKRFSSRVVTLDAEGATAFDRSSEADVVRCPPVTDHRLAVAALNLLSLREALRFRPDAVLSAHIVGSPAANLIRAALGTPYVQYLHADEVRGRPRLTAFAVARGDACIAVSSYTRDMALKAGAQGSRVHRIPNGVDPPAGVSQAKSARPTMVTVARLGEWHKGHDVVMRALPLIRSRVPSVRWLILGDGRLRREHEGAAAELGVTDHVEFRGRVSDETRDRALASSHVFVMPSRIPAGGVGGEGFGIAYLEANAHGLPVVAGAVGGALDAVVDGETGILVDPLDHLQVADAVADLLLNPEYANRLGATGARRAEQFEWSIVTRRVEEVLLDVIDTLR